MSFYVKKLFGKSFGRICRNLVYWHFSRLLFLQPSFFPAYVLLVIIVFIKDFKSGDIVSENIMFSLTMSFIDKNFTFLPPSGSYSVRDMRFSGFYPEAGREKFYGGLSGNLEGVLVNVSFFKVAKNTVIKIGGAISDLIFVLVCIYIGSAIFSALEPAHWISRYFGAGAGLLFAYMWLFEFNGIILKRRSIFEGLLIKCDFLRRFPAQVYILSKPVSKNIQSAVNKIVFAGGEVHINDKFFPISLPHIQQGQ